MYPASHPLVVDAIRESINILRIHLKEHDQVTITINENKIIADGLPVDADEPSRMILKSLFAKFGIDSLTFNTGLMETEMTALFQFFASSPKTDRKKALEEFFATQNISHIQSNQAYFTKLTKAEFEIFKENTGNQSGGRRSHWMKFLTGHKSGEESVGVTSGDSGGESGLWSVQGGGGDGGGDGGTDEIDSWAGTVAQLGVEEIITGILGRTGIEGKQVEEATAAIMGRLAKDSTAKTTESIQPYRMLSIQLGNATTRTEVVLSNVADGLLVVDDAGNILMANPAAENLLGMPLGELMGKSLLKTVSASHLLSLSKNISTPTDQSIESGVLIGGSAEAQQYLRAACAVVQNREGQVVGVLLTPPDVIKMRRLDQLEADIIPAVARELQSPAWNLRMALSNLQKSGALSDEQGKALAAALEEVGKIERFVGTLVVLSQHDSDELKIEPAPIRLDDIAKKAIGFLADSAKQKEITMSVAALENVLPYVSADADRILLVFVNLLTNAINHSPKKGEIVVRLSKDPHSEEFVRASVSDPGPDIRPEEKDWVFERFAHAEREDMSNAARGVGLELALAKAIVEVHRGLIWLETEPDKGTTYFFTLPIVKQQVSMQAESLVVPQPTNPPNTAPTTWVDNVKRFITGY